MGHTDFEGGNAATFVLAELFSSVSPAGQGVVETAWRIQTSLLLVFPEDFTSPIGLIQAHTVVKVSLSFLIRVREGGEATQKCAGSQNRPLFMQPHKAG